MYRLLGCFPSLKDKFQWIISDWHAHWIRVSTTYVQDSFFCVNLEVCMLKALLWALSGFHTTSIDVCLFMISTKPGLLLSDKKKKKAWCIKLWSTPPALTTLLLFLWRHFTTQLCEWKRRHMSFITTFSRVQWTVRMKGCGKYNSSFWQTKIFGRMVSFL